MLNLSADDETLHIRQKGATIAMAEKFMIKTAELRYQTIIQSVMSE